MVSSRWLGVGVLVLAGVAGLGGTTARADRVVLRGGGQVRGKIVPDPKNAAKVTIVLERGKTPMVVQRDRIVEVVPEPGPLDGYVVRLQAAPANAQGHYDLALYCEQHRLNDLAAHHFEQALRFDPTFAPAHEKLGHAKINGSWLSGDELRAAQGLVKYKGKWVTPEERSDREQQTAKAGEQNSWARRIRLWREALDGGTDDRAREAEAQFMSIRDPLAVTPLVKVLGNDPEPGARRLLLRVLGQITAPESAVALAHRLVAETDHDLRAAAAEELQRRDEPEGVKTLVQALRSSDPAIVNRAAWGLASLRSVNSVPSLIPALITTRQRMVMAPAGGSSEAGAIGATFGGYSAPYGLPGAPIAYNGSSIGILTPPAVGPGVVAFGATSVPAYPVPGIGGGLPYVAGSGLNVGGGLLGSRGPIPRMVTDTFQNTEVLAALKKLTGEDFGYDLNAWRRWLRTSFQPDPAPAKRVPQP